MSDYCAEAIMLYNLFDCCQISKDQFSRELTLAAVDITQKKRLHLIQHLKNMGDGIETDNDYILQSLISVLGIPEDRARYHKLYFIYHTFCDYEQKIMAMHTASKENIENAIHLLEYVNTDIAEYENNKKARLLTRIERYLNPNNSTSMNSNIGFFVFHDLMPQIIIDEEGTRMQELKGRYRSWRELLLKYDSRNILEIKPDLDAKIRKHWNDKLSAAFRVLRNTWTTPSGNIDIMRRDCGKALNTLYDTVVKMEEKHELVRCRSIFPMSALIIPKAKKPSNLYDNDAIISSGVLVFLRWLPMIMAEEAPSIEVLNAMDQIISNIQEPYSEYLAKTNKAADDRVFLNDDATALRSELIRALCRQSVFSEQFHSFYSGEG